MALPKPKVMNPLIASTKLLKKFLIPLSGTMMISFSTRRISGLSPF